jgi:tetratricopeptide (TPR) repeat protein
VPLSLARWQAESNLQTNKAVAKLRSRTAFGASSLSLCLPEKPAVREKHNKSLNKDWGSPRGARKEDHWKVFSLVSKVTPDSFMSSSSGQPAQSREDAALDAAYSFVWNDYLHNRVVLAERRAAPFLEFLPKIVRSKEQSDAQANRLINLADLAHIAGAVRDDPEVLRQALTAYDAHLKLLPNNLAARRMRAETLLRLGDYQAAFAAFDEMYRVSLKQPIADDVEVAPFQLIMDAECIDDSVSHMPLLI